MSHFWKVCVHNVWDRIDHQPEIEAVVIGAIEEAETPDPRLPKAGEEFYLVPWAELVAIEPGGLVYSDLVPKVAELLRSQATNSQDRDRPATWFYEDAREIVNLFAQSQGRVPGVQRFLDEVNAAKEAGEQFFQADPAVWYGGPPEKTEPRQA